MLSNEGSVRLAAQQLSDKGIRIHVLVNNAGILFHADQGLLQNDTGILYQTINTNSYGPLRVTRAFLNCLEAPGRVIMMSSSGWDHERRGTRMVPCILCIQNTSECDYQTPCTRVKRKTNLGKCRLTRLGKD